MNKKFNLQKLFENAKGNWGHKGRPGQVGGSAPGHGGSSPATKNKIRLPGADDPEVVAIRKSLEEEGAFKSHAVLEKKASNVVSALVKKFPINKVFDDDGEWNPEAAEYLDELVKKSGYPDIDELQDAIGEELDHRSRAFDWEEAHPKK